MGHTELSVSLAHMGELTPVSVLCEMLDKENGKAFRGFPLAKMIRGFMKVSKEMKRTNNK